MDAEINITGNKLYFVNTYFDNGNLAVSKVGIAEKNGNLFNRINNDAQILKQVNSDDYLVYAPSISSNQLELYVTRCNISSSYIENCVYTRDGEEESFSDKQVIPISGNMAEAVCVNNDMTRIYYHKKMSSGDDFAIYTMRREKKY